MRPMRLVLLPILLSTAGGPARADWIGGGVVVGEVIETRRVGDTLVFRLSITSQSILGGPKLGSPITFSYRGPDRAALTRGDVVRLRVEGNDALGISVEEWEPVDEPGIVAAYGGLLAIVLVALIAARPSGWPAGSRGGRRRPTPRS